MSKRVLCKYFSHGACIKGEHCEFSHDWKDQANNVCTFYQKGICSFGSRCRYDHVKVSQRSTSMPFSNPRPNNASSNFRTQTSVMEDEGRVTPLSISSSSSQSQLSAASRPFHPPTSSAWEQEYEPRTHSDDVISLGATIARPSDSPICSFAAAGNCPRGASCPHIHGDLCSICGKQCLHPFRPDEREDHIKLCLKNRKHLESLKRSQEIECCVCLDRVLSKPKASERKFGLLSECDHPFCISCIRNWRSNSPDSGMDVNSALRACPICRKLSYFVIPSVIWYSSKEEKQEIVDSYKTKLRSIDCRHFDFGNGTCPFGTSCFYKHTYKPLMIRERANSPQTSRTHANRPQTSRTRPNRSQNNSASSLLSVDEEELLDFALLDFVDQEELVDCDGEDFDFGSLMLEMSILLMDMGLDGLELSSEEED